ncbi:MAG: haloacid dehalogenase-like hydrolase [Polyangiaceae bacterium]|nr:haloacid dehalogenase-like hydrolase [Polyangiaceae bacterium]
MHLQSPDAVSRRIAEAHDREPRGFIAFDGDGTLWSGDLGEELFHALVRDDFFRGSAVERIRADARARSVQWDTSGSPRDTLALARALDAAFQTGAFPEEPMYELHAWAMAGALRNEIDHFVDRFLASSKLATRLQAEAVSVLEAARARGVDVYIVSASPLPVVEAAAALLGIPPQHVVAATPLYEGETMLPDVERPIPYGPGKVENLRRRCPTRPLLAAFGDSAFDAALLRAAEIGVAVRPKQRLRDLVATGELPGVVELGSASKR